MTLVKGTGSNSLPNMRYNTRSKAVADKEKNTEDKGNLTAAQAQQTEENHNTSAAQTKMTDNKITNWLSKRDLDSDSEVDAPKKKVKAVKQTEVPVKKTQQKLSGFVRVKKSTTNSKTGEQEDVQQDKTTTATTETTETDSQIITHTIQKTVVDTTTITKQASAGNKKVKLGDDEDADYDYLSDESTPEAMELDGSWTAVIARRPRRKAASTVSVSPLSHVPDYLADLVSPTPILSTLTGSLISETLLMQAQLPTRPTSIAQRVISSPS